jgi:N6-L-threonylcarbamoyladenine synthase
MKILAIETSCDETAAAVVSKNPKENFVKILSNVISSSLALHSKTGGVIPDVAAREQLKFIIPIIKKSIDNSKIQIKDIDAIAVTQGPGLIGSLLIGVETAKTLAYLWNKPIIPVNHLLGHIYANWLTPNNIVFPALVLLVSGGHTDLVLMKNHNEIKWLGGTLDDAAGEAFDKIGRLLDLSYPAGATIEKMAKNGDEKTFNFPRPMMGSKDFNFSFSGLKAAVMREVKKIKNMDEKIKINIATCVQKSIIEVLIKKTLKAAEKYNVKSILLSGGVASNQKLRDELKLKIARPPATLPNQVNKKITGVAGEVGWENCKSKIELFAPAKNLCTDNAAMIGAYALFHPEKTSWDKVTANPELYFQ